jgi:hypothetical protein
VSGPTHAESRLLDVAATAEYLGGISVWTVRAFIADGYLRPVRLPACHRTGSNNRRLLFDRRDLDKFIDERRHA